MASASAIGNLEGRHAAIGNALQDQVAHRLLRRGARAPDIHDARTVPAARFHPRRGSRRNAPGRGAVRHRPSARRRLAPQRANADSESKDCESVATSLHAHRLAVRMCSLSEITAYRPEKLDYRIVILRVIPSRARACGIIRQIISTTFRLWRCSMFDSMKTRSSRRDLFRRGGLLAAGPPFLGGSRPRIAAAPRRAGKLRLGPDIYQSIGVRPLINCRGTLTVISGSLELPEVRAAVGCRRAASRGPGRTDGRAWRAAWPS